MSTVQEIESAIESLDREKLQELLEWIENYVEDQMELADEFKAKLARAEQDIAEGRVRIIKPRA